MTFKSSTNLQKLHLSLCVVRVMNFFYLDFLREVVDRYRCKFYSSIVFFFWVCWSVLSCFVLSSRVEFSLLSLLCSYCWDSAEAVFYTHGRRSFCACEQNGGLIVGFWTLCQLSSFVCFKALSHCLSRSYAPSILFKKCSKLNLFRWFP